MKTRLKLAALALAIAIGTVMSVRRANALVCTFYIDDILTLELESVTEDGVPVADTSEYEAFDVRLEAWESEHFGFWAIKDGDTTWREGYE